MNASELDTFVAIPIPVHVYAELLRRYPRSVSSVSTNVIQDFLDRTSDDYHAEATSSEGIHWESLFLPDGSEVRTKHFGEYKVASIRGTSIVWQGNTYPSMSQLASAMRGGTSNNAWQVLEIKRPFDVDWQLAYRLRK